MLPYLEGIFARGDRRLSKAILKAYEEGCIFDAWGEYFDNEKWMQIFEDCGIDPDFYTIRPRETDEAVPLGFHRCRRDQRIFDPRVENGTIRGRHPEL